MCMQIKLGGTCSKLVSLHNAVTLWSNLTEYYTLHEVYVLEDLLCNGNVYMNYETKDTKHYVYQFNSQIVSASLGQDVRVAVTEGTVILGLDTIDLTSIADATKGLA